jgi:hypothetical protein
MTGTLLGLFFTHRKQREVERAKRAQYWREQVSRPNIGFATRTDSQFLERFPSKLDEHARNCSGLYPFFAKQW